MVDYLAKIRGKVRKLTGLITPEELSDDEISEYVKDFLEYDFPSTLKLRDTQTLFTFSTIPHKDVYDLRELMVDGYGERARAIDVFQNLTPPVFVSGTQCAWYQSREEFFAIWPKYNQTKNNGHGNGTPGPYRYTFPSRPVLQRSLIIGAVDEMGEGYGITDNPTSHEEGTLRLVNDDSVSITGSINYVTGEIQVTFPGSIPVANKVTFSARSYRPSRPYGILYFDNTLTLRPIPDQVYLIEMVAFKRLVPLSGTNMTPEVAGWWKYISYGAAKNVLEDLGDMPAVARITPELKNQERLVRRKTIVQNAFRRSRSAYQGYLGYGRDYYEAGW